MTVMVLISFTGSSDQCHYWWHHQHNHQCYSVGINVQSRTFKVFDTEDLFASVIVLRLMDFVVRVAVERCVVTSSEQGFLQGRDDKYIFGESVFIPS